VSLSQIFLGELRRVQFRDRVYAIIVLIAQMVEMELEFSELKTDNVKLLSNERSYLEKMTWYK
jgi:hypothetical protein